MSKLRDRRTRHDHFYRRAKQERFAARSVFKLEEIDRRFRLVGPRKRVLDLGCRPGSWLQYVAERVGRDGVVVGLDRTPLEIELPPQARALVGDVMTVEPSSLRGDDVSCFHLVLSDMAPDTTGVAFADQVRSIELSQRALELAGAVGCPGSNFVCKVFMGEGFADLVADAKRRYGKTKTVRPEATRKSSTEVYLVALGLMQGR